jgi:hypothetical protein
MKQIYLNQGKLTITKTEIMYLEKQWLQKFMSVWKIEIIRCSKNIIS